MYKPLVFITRLQRAYSLLSINFISIIYIRHVTKIIGKETTIEIQKKRTRKFKVEIQDGKKLLADGRIHYMKKIDTTLESIYEFSKSEKKS